MFDVQAFILVGGASRRMGRDKASLRFGRQTGVELITRALQSVSRSVTTVGFLKHELDGLPNIPDLRADWGPLAGIEAALQHTITSTALIVGCDFPFVTAELFGRLLKNLDEADAVVPLQSDGRIQPLCAVYKAGACLPAALAAINAGEHSPRALLERVPTLYLPFAEFSHFSNSEHFFFNVNTPENYERALAILNEGQNRER